MLSFPNLAEFRATLRFVGVGGVVPHLRPQKRTQGGHGGDTRECALPCRCHDARPRRLGNARIMYLLLVCRECPLLRVWNAVRVRTNPRRSNSRIASRAAFFEQLQFVAMVFIDGQHISFAPEQEMR